MGKQKLIEHISQFDTFNEDEIKLILEHVTERTLAPNEMFLEKGKTETELAFIVSGVFRFYYYDEEGNEVISSLVEENQYATILSAYTGVSISPVYIQAITKAHIVSIDKDAWLIFTNQIPSWGHALQKIGINYFVNKTQFQRQIIKLNAEESYLHFARTYPGLLKRVPLTYIANYLGMTPYSLSRVRKKINENKS